MKRSPNTELVCFCLGRTSGSASLLLSEADPEVLPKQKHTSSVFGLLFVHPPTTSFSSKMMVLRPIILIYITM